MTILQPLAVQHPSVWTATQQLARERVWCYHLSAQDLAEVDAALRYVQANGLALTVSLQIVPADTFSSCLPRLANRGCAAWVISGLPAQDVTQESFKLPTLGPKLRQFVKEVVDGRGFQIIKGLPVDRYTAAESTTVYWGLGTYWGKIVPQNKKAHLIGHVRVCLLCLRLLMLRLNQALACGSY